MITEPKKLQSNKLLGPGVETMLHCTYQCNFKEIL